MLIVSPLAMATRSPCESTAAMGVGMWVTP
jgi:hypothetical protein